MQVKLQVSTVHLYFAAQAPDATTASLALQDNKAKPECQKASEVCQAHKRLSEWEEILQI